MSIRVLHVTEVLEAAGIESFIMNVYRNIDRSKIQFDFLVMRNKKEFYDDEISILGGAKYTIDVPIENTLLRIQRESFLLYKFLKEHKYNIVHIHSTTPLRAPYLLAAKIAGVKVRIYHSHSAEVLGKSKLKLAIYRFYKRRISRWATDFFACSLVAAEWMFEKVINESKTTKIIYNGIDIDKFKFNQHQRDEFRKKFKLEDKFVLVHTGRFLEQKNQTFVLDVFNELIHKRPNSVLIFIGKGPLIEKIKEKVSLLQLTDNVLFLGVRNDVPEILNASDLFIMPSLYEGLPVAAVEAQCSGLPCIFSTNITSEVDLTGNNHFLSLEDSVQEWSDIISYKIVNICRDDIFLKIITSGYSVAKNVKLLQDFYEEICYR